jgi:hypothetical protein
MRWLCWESRDAVLADTTIVIVRRDRALTMGSRARGTTERKKGLLAIRQAPETLGTCPRASRVCRSHEGSGFTVPPQSAISENTNVRSAAAAAAVRRRRSSVSADAARLGYWLGYDSTECRVRLEDPPSSASSPALANARQPLSPRRCLPEEPSVPPVVRPNGAEILEAVRGRRVVARSTRRPAAANSRACHRGAFGRLRTVATRPRPPATTMSSLALPATTRSGRSACAHCPRIP